MTVDVPTWFLHCSADRNFLCNVEFTEDWQLTNQVHLILAIQRSRKSPGCCYIQKLTKREKFHSDCDLVLHDVLLHPSHGEGGLCGHHQLHARHLFGHVNIQNC